MAEQHELDRELYSLLKKEGADPRTFAGVAAGLQAELESTIPMRSTFKADLRGRLMAEAAGRRPPRWFQRPALWSAMGGVAAVFVLAIGLRLFHELPTPGGAAVAPDVSVPNVPPKDTTPAHLVGKTTLPLVHVPDQPQTESPAGTAGLESAKELPAYQLTGTVDASLVKGIAERLNFQEPSPVSEGGYYRVAEGSRVVQVSRTGAFRYEDAAAPTATPSGATSVTEAQAVQAANQFLQTAALPIVDANPKVGAEAESLVVSYQDRHEGRPIVGGSTRVWVNRAGSVRRVESFTPSGEQLVKNFEAVSYAEAIQAAESKGGTFDRGDLVWVRTSVGETVYLQPYWRLFGTNASGTEIVRYVPALER